MLQYYEPRKDFGTPAPARYAIATPSPDATSGFVV